MDIIDTRETAEGYQLIIGYLGYVTILIGFIVLLPLLTLLFYPEEMENAKCFIIPGVLTVLTGYLLTFFIRGKERGRLYKNQDMIIVLFTWIITIFTGAVPFVLTGQYSFTQAIFEATSGFSTTGLSVVDVTLAPKIFLMHRGIMLFFGGIGLILVMTSVLSEVHGMRLYNAEGHSDKLLPNLLKSARLIITIYFGYILGGTILYVIFGMEVFDALNHSIAAVSTGGFSTKAESIGYYQSFPIELITIVLMFLGGTNFFVHLLLLKGKMKSFFRHCEVKLSLLLTAILTPIVAVLMLDGMYSNIPSSLRSALFQVVSALTTTGFQTVPTFTTWSPGLLFPMILLMLVGGGAGSTAGGIKQYRIYVMLKEIWWNIREQISHKRIIQVNQIERFGKKQPVDLKAKTEINVYILLYLILFALGTWIFTLFGYSLEHAMFEFSSALGTVGLSVGITGYNAHPVILWTGTVGMLIGRLEIYIIFLGLIRLSSDMGGMVIRRDAKSN